MAALKNPWLALVLSAVSGVGGYFAFKPAGLWYLAPLALVGLYLALTDGGFLRSYLNGLVFALAQFLPMLTWAYNAAGLLPYLALAVASGLLLAIGPAAYGCIRFLWQNHWRQNHWLDAAAFAVTLAAADTLRSFVPFGGFPWGRVAFSQTDGPMLRWAWLGGAPLTGLAVAFVAGLAVAAVRLAFDRRFAACLIGAAGALLLVAGPVLFPISSNAEQGSLRVAAIQGNVHVTAEGLFAQQREVLENHVGETERLMARPGVLPVDLVVWPENSTDIDPREDAEAGAAIDRAAESAKAPILVGAMRYLPDKHRYNQALLWQAGQGVLELYSKRHPAPFAEYMPARSFFRLFTSKVDLISTDMLPGDRVGIFQLNGGVAGREVLVGDVICFEVAYDSVVADTVDHGAEVIMVQTNNASFGMSEESTQQFAMTRLRAVEFGRATLQISTVGVSGAVAPDGSLLTPMTGLFEAGSFVVDMPLRTSLTPAVVIGPLTTWILLVLGAVVTVVGLGGRMMARFT
ncbi:MAG: apolipoprotein N-acyltransferase [Bifidobacteriaceae bacterium]|jgi:apolipoprotein N-acyltransferase|nr:apolipoprotein N-acyltransferase [Bifidobacteriaceae bacterium]